MNKTDQNLCLQGDDFLVGMVIATEKDKAGDRRRHHSVEKTADVKVEYTVGYGPEFWGKTPLVCHQQRCH